ncbi:DUF5005 domain-containing protein [Cesiribacter sp. SM1]|uniref:DUF5005 domain-containing protein n=1 Tax=Cesiribacter sp. SM1 TaxID=2861196 RepID=UPI001CD393B1|nr:DUF5005 domain-containing protein [Cesiribacter sp. SM1]
MKQIVYFIILFAVLFQEVLAQSPAYKDEAFTEFFRRTSGWVASDATISIPLPQNRALWLFGDTHIDGYEASDNSIPCLFQVRNSMMVQDMEHPEEFITILDNTQEGINRTPVKDPENEELYFWPGHGYSKGDTTVVFWGAYTGAGMEHRATYLTKIYTPDLTDASAIKEMVKLPLPGGIEWGNAVVVDSASQYLYIYGQMKDWILFRPLVARVSMEQDILSAWEFFDGNTWTSGYWNAQQVMGSTDDYVSPSFSVIKLQDKYYMISQDIGFLTCGYGREIYSWESNSPQGPFTNKKLLYTIEDKYQGEYWVTYNATAHPEFIRNNELLISYNVNGFANNGVEGVSCQNECRDAFRDRRHADGYRPKFIRVPLTYIDPTLNVPDRYFPETDPTGLPAGWVPLKQVRVYPNPSAGDRFTVEVNSAAPGVAIKIQVRDLQGKLVLEQDMDGTSTNIQLRSTGMFLLYITAGNKMSVSKVVVR